MSAADIIPRNGPTFVPTHLHFHSFSSMIGQQCFLYDVLKLQDSVMIFINAKENKDLSDLSLAMKNRFSDIPTSTMIIGDFTEETSKMIAAKVSRKLDKVVFVSLNVSCDKNTQQMIQRQLFIEIKENPHKF